MDNNFKSLNGIYREIAEEFDMNTAQKMHSLFKGLNIHFPISFYDREYIAQCIKNEYTGKNTRELARKYSYSERWIRKICEK